MRSGTQRHFGPIATEELFESALQQSHDSITSTMAGMAVCASLALLVVFTCFVNIHATKLSTPIISSLKYSEIVDGNAVTETTPTRKFPLLQIYGFVTPWNEKGKLVSLSEAEKGRLDVAVPVSWQMHPDGLAGGQDFESYYYQKLSKHGTRVFPRILFEKWNREQFKALFHDAGKVVEAIADVCKSNGFEGVVLEIFQALLATGTLMYHQQDALKLMRTMGEGLRQEQLKTVLVLLPYDRDVAQHGISCSNLQELTKGYSAVITMTYDYSTPGSGPGPVAPLPWVRRVAKYLSQECELWGKVLLGLNFYGVDFCNDGEDRHIIGHEVVKLLERHKPEMMWWDEYGEHGFGYRDGKDHIVVYPSRESIRLRMEVADEMGCGGVAVWDLGQGLNNFFEEF
ncbi:unnamed protein product [Agarophyton chilense]|eukprot:gb/GEZJ01002341.1/.p1 GENE.gb/GEZJ01002341.1/~~gb/GEZJ01002341.1/.p1  ORF type:complete len:399 (+),score=41.58 gb/GEZJ01002341.1/:1148-2344(+)